MGWMRRLPTWARATIAGVLFTVAWWASTFITIPELTPWQRVVVSLPTGAAYGIVMGIFLARMRRGYGGVLNDPRLRRALRHGEVPPDADIDEWRGAVRHHQAQYRPMRWAVPVVFIPMTALSIWLAVTDEPRFWFAAGFFVAVGVFCAIITPRVLRNSDAMLTELDRREQEQQVRR